MRTDRGWRRFYGIGWLVSAGVGAFAFTQWHAYVREVERRAEEAERTRDEVARRRAVDLHRPHRLGRLPQRGDLPGPHSSIPPTRVRPPSITTVCPVIQPASCDSRKETAPPMSSGSPSRWRG